jgi:hypothetical protein
LGIKGKTGQRLGNIWIWEKWQIGTLLHSYRRL